MIEKTYARKRSALALSLAGALALGACGSDPVAPGHEDEVESVQLVLNGAVIAEFDGDSRTWTGELEVAEGEETTHIDVRFLDHDGEEIVLDDDLYLEVDIADETVAEFEQDTPGELGGHLHGVSAGETTAIFKLMHGAIGSGHPDFETTAVDVHVN